MKYKEIEDESIRQCCRQIMYICKTQGYTPSSISGVIARYTDTTTVHGFNLKQKGITAETIIEYLCDLDVYKQWIKTFE